MRRACIAILLTLLLFSCSAKVNTSPRTLNIAAASDLQFAVSEAAKEFHVLHPDIELKTTYGSSGNFYTQISNGAPFEMFLSADMEYPRKLQSAGLAIAGTDFEYAVGRIVVWTRKDSPLDVEHLGMQSLIDPSIQHLAIANPEHAPYGRAAVSAMQHFGVYDHAQRTLVFGENVSQALQFIDSGAAEIGIVAMSLASAPTVKPKGKYWEIPLESYPKMDQGGVILQGVKDRQAADDFRAYLLGAEGKAILKNFGFFLPGDSK